MGNLTAEGAAAGASPATETYSYDPLYRLTAITEGTTAIEGFTYNPTGDRLSKTGTGLGVGSYAYAPGTHRLSGIGTAARTADANGNTTASSSAGQTWGYGYNGRNRLTVVQAGGVTVGTYTYNAMGQRVQKVTATTERYGYSEGGQLMAEYGATNRDYIWLGDIPVATVDTAGSTSTVNYVTADQLGTPRAVSDGSGTTIWSWAYAGNPFGEQQPTSTAGYVLNLRYPGQYYDAETGVNYWGFRSYEAATGRPLQSDPIGLLGGMSTYAYAQNNPLRYIDPSGLWVCAAGNCDSFRNALQSLINASTSSNLAPYQQATLANIVSAYGAEGVPNVQIKYGPLGPGIEGATGKDKDTGCETIIFDDKKLKVPLYDQYLWGSDVAHEGQHLSDDLAGDVNNASNVSRYDTEVNAYTAQAYYDKAIQFADPSSFGSLWTSSGGINYDVIQSRAGRSTNYAH